MERGEKVGVRVDGPLQAFGRAVHTPQRAAVDGVLHAAYVSGQAADELGCLVCGIKNFVLECASEIVWCLPKDAKFN